MSGEAAAPAAPPPAPAAEPAAPAPAPAGEASPTSASQRAAEAAAAAAAPQDPTPAPADPAAEPAAPAPAGEPSAAVHPALDVLGRYSEAEQTALVSLMDLLHSDPAAGAKEMQRLASLILDDDPADPAGEPPAGEPPTEEPDIPKTKEELEAYLEERERRRKAAEEEDRAIEEVFTEAEKLTGLQRGSLEMKQFLELAVSAHEGDIKAAWEAQQAKNQAIIDAYIASVAERNEAFPVQPGGSTTPADATGGPPKDFKAAKASLLQRLSRA